MRYNLQRRIVMDGHIVARYYLTEGSMLVDVLSTTPAIVQVGRPEIGDAFMPSAPEAL